MTDVPLAVGFGVSRPEHVAACGGDADHAIVASATLDLMRATPAGEHAGALRALRRRCVDGRVTRALLIGASLLIQSFLTEKWLRRAGRDERRRATPGRLLALRQQGRP